MTSETQKKIEDMARKIRDILGKNFTGSVEFHCVQDRDEVKYTVKYCGVSK